MIDYICKEELVLGEQLEVVIPHWVQHSHGLVEFLDTLFDPVIIADPTVARYVASYW